MASQFEEAFGSGKFANRLRTVGVILILLGVVIVIWPVVAVWLTAAVFVLLGIMVLMAGSMLKRMDPTNW